MKSEEEELKRGAEAQISEGAEEQMEPDIRENEDIKISEGGRAIGQRDILYSERSKSKRREPQRGSRSASIGRANSKRRRKQQQRQKRGKSIVRKKKKHPSQNSQHTQGK